MHSLSMLKQAIFLIYLTTAILHQRVQCVTRVLQREEYSITAERNDQVELLLGLAHNSFALSRQAAFLRLPEVAKGSIGMLCSYLDQAVALEPYKLDLYFSAAAAQIFNNNLSRAMAFYRRALQLAPKHQDLLIYLAAYSHCAGDMSAYNRYLSLLSTLDHGRAEMLQLLIKDIEEEFRRPIRHKLTADMPTPEAIIVLGQRVKTDGTLPESLQRRVRLALEVAKIFPSAHIVTSGGKTSWVKSEARQIADWLTARGVAKERIIMEEYSRTTIENAHYCLDILNKSNLTKILIISSDNHVRRACLDFRIASRLSGRRVVDFIGLAIDGTPKSGSDQEEQKIGLYRDALQIFGLAHFRSYPLVLN